MRRAQPNAPFMASNFNPAPFDVTETYPVLRQGDRGPQVKALQIQLNQTLTPPRYPVFVSLATDGNFGPKTDRRVRLAQFRYLRFQDGVVDEGLWRSLREDRALIETLPILRRYSMGHPVGALQQLLKTVGFYNGPLDCRFGFMTEEAVKDFQASQPPPESSVIAVNGVVDAHNWTALEALALFQLFE